MPEKQLFDDWPERYDRWFETSVGKAVLRYERDLMLEMLQPGQGERILDAGCGTGIFTREFLSRGADVVGIDLSLPMLVYALRKAALMAPRSDRRPAGQGAPAPGSAREPIAPTGNGGPISTPSFRGITADMTALPFADGTFDKTVSVAALEFIADEKRAIAELFRVTRPGGLVVAATLNSLSPWAARRSAQARRDPESIFNRVFFRSPAQLLAATDRPGMTRTAVHFDAGDDPAAFDRREREGRGSDGGAFVAACWQKR